MTETDNPNDVWFHILGSSARFNINIETVVTQSQVRMYRELENAALTIAANTKHTLIIFVIPPGTLLSDTHYLVFVQNEDQEPFLEPVLKSNINKYLPNIEKDVDFNQKTPKRKKPTGFGKPKS